MQPTPGDVHVNTPLTNISIAFMQSASNFIGTSAFPNIPVAKQSDRYWTFNRGDFNRDEMQERAPGTESAGGGYNVDSTPTYYCRVYAFHKDVHDQMRANADSALQPDREATQFVTQKAMIKREKVWANAYFKTGIWGEEDNGVASGAVAGTSVLHWSDGASMPIEQVRKAKQDVLRKTGYEPNKLILGKPVYDALLDHPDVIDRLKYGQTAGSPAMANRERLAQLFEVDDIMVSKAIENTAAEGATESSAFILGKHALLCYAAPSPGLQTPTAGYTFSWTGYLGASAEGIRMKQFRMENLEADRVEIQMAFDAKLISADLGFFWNGVVA
jgi:hypothetical protein